MEFLETYMSEIMIGGSGTLGTIMVAILKGFGSKLDRIDKRLGELEKNLEVNTMLDKERAKK